jgi:hypothetical protein
MINETMGARQECKIAMLAHLNMLDQASQGNQFFKVIESTCKIYELCNTDNSIIMVIET